MGWLKDCAICNEGLCSTVDELKEKGLSENKIFKRMSDESEGHYTEGAIRQRYKYYKGGEKTSPSKEKRSSTKRSNLTDVEKQQIFSDEFKVSYKNIFQQIEIEKNNNWEKTSKEAVSSHITKLKDLIRKK
jgi:hypothetical protein